MSESPKLPAAALIQDLWRSFVQSESAGGLVLIGASALALVVANSPASDVYAEVLHTYVLGLSLLHWVNDALMALFFLLVGLEMKREMVEGELSSWPSRVLPGMAALGGMVVPALVYVAVNLKTPETLVGWAIPCATDIAFALGILSLLGSRVPISLKAFLTALAILDDLGAVAIIAAFYSTGLSLPMLGLALAVIVALAVLNWWRIDHLAPYLLLGAVLWYFVLKSGVHATLAGVALAFLIPIRRSGDDMTERDPALIRLEHTLQPWVAFAVVPIFGLANAGVDVTKFSAAALVGAVPLGIALGLFVGKQIGVFGAAWLAVRVGLAERPTGASWTQLYGIALLCGIGFTMSLFIGSLAFESSLEMQDAAKIGVLAGSLVAAFAGAALLLAAKPPVHDNR